MTIIQLVLPTPPSVNALYRNVSPAERRAALARGQKLPGRVKTPVYIEWLRHAGWLLNLTRPKPVAITGDYALDLFLPPSRKDPDNCVKAVSDFLVERGLIPDDREAKRACAEIVVTIDQMHVLVRPWDVAPRLADEWIFPWRSAA